METFYFSALGQINNFFLTKLVYMMWTLPIVNHPLFFLLFMLLIHQWHSRNNLNSMNRFPTYKKSWPLVSRLLYILLKLFLRNLHTYLECHTVGCVLSIYFSCKTIWNMSRETKLRLVALAEPCHSTDSDMHRIVTFVELNSTL